VNGTATTIRYCAPALHTIPIHTSGCVYAGLGDDTVLTINLKIIVENFPSPISALFPVAKPAPAYDPAAIALMSHIVRKLPVGTRFKNNGEGNWFMAGVRDALRLAAPILQAIPHPIAQGLGMGAKLAGEVSLAGEDQRPTKPQGGALPKKKKTKAKVNNLAIRNATAAGQARTAKGKRIVGPVKPPGV